MCLQGITCMHQPIGCGIWEELKSNPGCTFVKAITTATGELEYDSIFYQQEGEEEIAFLPVGFILWIIFLALILILFDNLLV